MEEKKGQIALSDSRWRVAYKGMTGRGNGMAQSGADG